MPSRITAGSVIFAKDITLLAAFYEKLLALPIVHAEQGHIVLESEILQLVIHGIPVKIARNITISSPPELREDGAIKPFFPVADLAIAREAAKQLGGGLYAAGKEWEARGFRACDGFDPEGNIFQLRQSLT